MARSDEHQSSNGGRIDDVDRAGQISNAGDSVDASPEGGAETPDTTGQSVTQRSTHIFVADGDGDLLLQREGDFLEWLRALDMQVMGACREDERLKPLLKLNVSAGVAEDGLLAHLSQHFEPSEVGLLARCLCVPLVSIRVGKINKQGSVMSPTSVRGNLCLTLLPTSDLRIIFNGDDGSVEKLATLISEAQSTAAQIEKIPADKSGRSFLIRISDSKVSYFWCSERSKLLGDELLEKMNDLLMRKPSLAELTGITESRLSYLASHLRAYLTDTVASNAEAATIHSTDSFKEGLQKSLSSSNIASDPSTSIGFQKDKLPEFAAFSFVDVFGKSTELPNPVFSTFSPQYCWCTIGDTQQIPISSSEPFSLPPLSSLLSSTRKSSLNVAELPPLNFPSSQQISTFTPLICEPIVHIPVIEVCSSGQGYLVSAGVGISTSMNGESAVEKGARETLRMLINGSSNQSSGDCNVFGAYGGTRDVIAMSDGMSGVGLGLFSEKSVYAGGDELVDQKEKASGGGSSGFDEGMS